MFPGTPPKSWAVIGRIERPFSKIIFDKGPNWERGGLHSNLGCWQNSSIMQLRISDAIDLALSAIGSRRYSRVVFSFVAEYTIIYR